MLVHAIPTNVNYEFAAEVRDGLTRAGQKELPSKYLYDDVGSALFEVISHLPEYGLTRADERLLRRHANEIVDRVQGPVAAASSVFPIIPWKFLTRRWCGVSGN
jgi:L-histidine N-alpha-methyltransferase